jgi:hypothetical protein
MKKYQKLTAPLLLCFLLMMSYNKDFAQLKQKVVSHISGNQEKMKKKESVKLDTIQLKPPGGSSGSEVIYGDEAIWSIINEAGDSYNNGFTAERIIDLIKKKYSLSLAQATRVMYNAYYQKYKKQDLLSSWPYDLQVTISNAYKSTNINTPKLLKDGGETIIFPFTFFYWHFLSLANPTFYTDWMEKTSDHFKLCIEAGYQPEEVYLKAIHPIHTIAEQQGYIEPFVLGMKKAHQTVEQVLSLIGGKSVISKDLNGMLLRVGYTQAEIDNATTK